MKFDPERRNFLKLMGKVGFLAALSGISLTLPGCDDSDSEPYQKPKTFKDYPTMFLDENGNLNCYLVPGNTSGDVLTTADISIGIQNMTGQTIETKLYNEIGDINDINTLNQNLILVGRNGSYCNPGEENYWIDRIGIQPLNPEEGLIQIFERPNGTLNLIVTGYSQDSIENCGIALLDPDYYGLKQFKEVPSDSSGQTSPENDFFDDDDFGNFSDIGQDEFGNDIPQTKLLYARKALIKGPLNDFTIKLEDFV